MNDKKAGLIFPGNGTMTDPSTGLMWMLPLLGQGWDGNSGTGTIAVHVWHEATERYGRGRLITLPPNPQRPHWEVASVDRPKLSPESYEAYQFGTKNYEFAGFNDWRMPVVEEVFTLMETGVYDDVAALRLGFRMCTANPSTISLHEKYEKKSKKSVLRRMLGNPYSPFGAWIWEAHLDVNTIFGDHPDSHKYWVRLVRLGNLFQATH